MTPFGLSGLLTATTSFAFGLFVLLMSQNRRIAITWFLFTLSVGCWGLGAFWIGARVITEPQALLVWRISYALGVIWISPLFYHFVCAFLGLSRPRSILANYLVSTAVFITLPTPLFFSHARWIFNSLYYARGGILYPFFFVWWLGLVLYSHVELLRKYASVTSGKQNQIKYFFFATAVGYAGGSMAYLPNLGIDIYPWGNFAIVLYPLIMSYAITRHQLMDIELVARSTVAKIGCLLLVGVPLLIGRLLAESLVTLSFSGLARTIGILAASSINLSVAIMLLSNYRHALARRLCQFCLLLGIWNTAELLLVTPPHTYSTNLYRAAYAIGCLVLLAWFRLWDEQFQSRSANSTGYKYLMWTAYAMATVCTATPWILRSLKFDVTRRTPAVEVAGDAQWVFASWFLVALAGIACWAARHLWQLRKQSRLQFNWTLLTFALATAAATTYFLYVPRFISVPIHAYLEIAMVVSLCVGYLRFRPLGDTVQIGIGIVAVSVPLAAGLLFTQGAWGQIAGGMLLVTTIPAILDAIKDPVQSWVDNIFFKDFRYISESERLARKDWNLSALEDALPIVAKNLVSTAPFRSCTISVIFEDRTKRPRFRTTQIRTHDRTVIEGSPWSEELDLAFLHLVRREKRLVVRGEENQTLPPLIKGVDPLLFEAAVALKSGTDVIGVIVVGPKEGAKTALHHKDFEILEALAKGVAENLAPSLEINLFRCIVADSIHDAISNYLRPVLNKLELELPIIEEDTRTLKKLRELLKQLRATAQTQLTKSQREEEDTIDVRAMLKDAFATHRVDAEAKGLRFELKLPKYLPTLRKNRLWLDRCVGNLITNAIKYTRHGSIELAADASRTGLSISVSDTGIGIATDLLGKIFSLGYRVPGQSQIGIEGTGVGLANVKELMVALGGKVRVESIEGQGSRFTLSFSPIIESQTSDTDFAERKVANG